MVRETGVLVWVAWLALVNCSPPKAQPVPTPTGVGVSAGEAVTAELSAAGGLLASPDGAVELVIPPGAVPTSTTFSLEPVTNLAHGGLGHAYRLRPEGVAFTAAVTLRFHVSDAQLAGRPWQVLMVASQDPDGTWRREDAVVDAAAHTVTAHPTHFSDWSLVEGFRLAPTSATLRPGQSLKLKAQYCFAPTATGGPWRGYACDQDEEELGLLLPIPSTSNWAVNGAPGGSPVDGTVAGTDNGFATYVAPAKKPAANPVAVSTELKDPTGAKVVLVSNVKISQAIDRYDGTLDVDTEQIGFHVTGKVHVTVALVEHRERDLDKYEGTGEGLVTVTPEVQGMDCTPVQTTLPFSELLEVYEAGDSIRGAIDPFRSKLWLSATVEDFTVKTQCCSDGSCSEQEFHGFVSSGTGCDVGAMPTWTDELLLEGEGTFGCNGAMVSTVKWSLTGHEAQ